MKKEEEELKLPDWFRGELYTEGAEVINPYSLESCYLNPVELSMYDFIKGCEMIISATKTMNKQLNEDFYNGLWWFKDNCPKKYMILLD